MRRLVTKTNVDTPTSDYPFGRIRNNPGDGSGTPFNELLYGDIQQFFEKMFDQSQLSANGFPDNAYSGFQLFTAALLSFRRYQKTYTPVGGGTLTIPPFEQALIYGTPGMGPGQQVQLPAMATTCDGHTVKVVNDETVETIDILADVNIGYITAPPYTVATTTIREFTLIKSISTWIVSEK